MPVEIEKTGLEYLVGFLKASPGEALELTPEALGEARKFISEHPQILDGWRELVAQVGTDLGVDSQMVERALDRAMERVGKGLGEDVAELIRQDGAQARKIGMGVG